MDFVINSNELAVLCGLPHIQQLAYLRGIRPYMDVKTGIVGIKRGISYQSISEQLYIEPHPGIKSQSYSRAQVRRALVGLQRAGIIELQSVGLQLILKCQLATRGYSVQNKAVIKPSQKSVPEKHENNLENKEFSGQVTLKDDIDETAKADTPLNNNYYFIVLLQHFEKFWALYPLKKSRQKAWEQFQALNPDDTLFAKIEKSLQEQVTFAQQQQYQGQWVAPWKYPTNWLAQRCWEDEIPNITINNIQEKSRAEHRKNTRKTSGTDMFWSEACREDEFSDEASSGLSNESSNGFSDCRSTDNSRDNVTNEYPTTTNIVQFQRPSK